MLRKIFDERGQAIVEMALIAPILLMFLLGIIEFARLYNAYLTIDNATRTAARMGTVGANDADMEDKITELSTSLPNTDSLVVNITPAAANRTSGSDLTVKTSYSFEFIAPLFGNLFGNPLTLNSTITMRLE